MIKKKRDLWRIREIRSLPRWRAGYPATFHLPRFIPPTRETHIDDASPRDRSGFSFNLYQPYTLLYSCNELGINLCS